MRVTYVAYDDSPPLGGQGVVVAGMRREMERRGVDTATIAGRGEHAVRYPRVLRRAPLDLSMHLQLHPQVIARTRPEVVHAHGGPGGVILLRHLPAPLVYTAHHTYRQAHPRASLHRLPAPLEAASYRRAEMVLCVSPSTADAVRAMGVAPSRIEVLPNGVTIPPDENAHEEARILFLGRLEENKGVLDAVTAMRALVRDVRGAHAVIVGGGSQMDAVRAAVGDESRIDVVGPVDEAAAQREYARATLLLMPSRYEGLGLSALEAQAAGTPVVAYDVDGLRDAVREGGVLVPSGDVRALTDAARALLRDPARRQELGAAGRAMVRRDHSWERAGDRLLEVYESVARAA